MLTCGLVRSNFALATWAPPHYLLTRWNLSCRCWLALPGDDRGHVAGAPKRLLLASDLLDDLVGDVLRNLGVRVELHRVRRLTRGLGPQVANVPEHLGQGHKGVDDHVTVTLLLSLDLAAPAVEVADDGAEERLGSRDLDREHRLQQHGLGLARGLLE